MTKKFLALLLCLAMLATTLVACAPKAPVTPDPTPAPSAQGGEPSTPVETPDLFGPDGREKAEEQVYHKLYGSEMTTMNYLIDGGTYNLEVGANTIDSLVENDPFGKIIPSAAESWEQSTDGLVWTFHLRPGQFWYDADGNQKDPVTAHDYVAAARYVCDSAMNSDTSYMMEGWLVNAEELLAYTSNLLAAVPQGTEAGEDQDYVIDANGALLEGSEWDAAAGKYTVWTPVPEVKPEDLGVVAKDDLTLEYHLVMPRPYFLTALQFGTYWPAPASLLAELGENYGLDNRSMWFNGAYILSTFEPQQKRIYTRNENNWDAEHVYIERIEETNNAESTTLAPEMFLRGEVDYADLSSEIAMDWLSDPEKSQMIATLRVTGSYSYFMGFNFEPKFDAQYEPENWGKAVNNENFRKAIFHAIDKETYVAARYPGDDPDMHIVNTITPRGFAFSDSGKDYGTFGNLEKFTTTKSFNADLAVQYMQKAKPELEAAGVTFPIKVPVNFRADTKDWVGATVVMEQQVEALLGTDLIDIIPEAWAGGGSFLGETRRNGNYAIQELNWGADYMDPETWTDPFLKGNNYNFAYPDSETYSIGQNTKTPETLALIEQYAKLITEAKAEVKDMEKRLAKFAEAEAFYIEHAMVLPMFVSGGSYIATKLNGFEGQFAVMGQSTSRYKGQYVYKTAMSMDMFNQQYEAWYASMGK